MLIFSQHLHNVSVTESVIQCLVSPARGEDCTDQPRVWTRGLSKGSDRHIWYIDLEYSWHWAWNSLSLLSFHVWTVRFGNGCQPRQGVFYFPLFEIIGLVLVPKGELSALRSRQHYSQITMEGTSRPFSSLPLHTSVLSSGVCSWSTLHGVKVHRSGVPTIAARIPSQ